jgi:hypothetical protein
MKLSKLSLPLSLISLGLLGDIAKKLKNIPTAERCKYNDHTEPEHPVTATAKSPTPESDQSGDKSKKNKNRWKVAGVVINACTFVVLTLTLVAVCKYTREATRQRKAMESQLRETQNAIALTLKVVKGTTAARVELNHSMEGPDASRQILLVEFANSGRVEARNLESDYYFIIQSLPEKKIISRIYRKIRGNNTYAPASSAWRPVLETRGYTQDVLESIKQTKMAVVLKGEFHYNDGFDEILPGSFCYWYASFKSGGLRWRTCDASERELKFEFK